MKYFEYLAVELKDFQDFKRAKEKIMLRLVPYSSELDSEGIVYRKFLNMAVTYYYMFSSETEIIPLKKSHIDRWKVNENDIYKVAMENTPKRFPPVLEKVEEYMLKTLVEGIKEESIKTKTDLKILVMALFEVNLSEEDFDMICENGKISSDKVKRIIIDRAVGKKKMYVLTNRLRIHGAACMLYPKCMKEIAGRIGSDLYIIPASIHELVLLTVDKDIKLEELKSDVLSANEEMVEPENRLSDDVYIYERETDTIKIV